MADEKKAGNGPDKGLLPGPVSIYMEPEFVEFAERLLRVLKDTESDLEDLAETSLERIAVETRIAEALEKALVPQPVDP